MVWEKFSKINFLAKQSDREPAKKKLINKKSLNIRGERMRDLKSALFFVLFTLSIRFQNFRGRKSVEFANLLTQLAAEHAAEASNRMRCSSLTLISTGHRAAIDLKTSRVVLRLAGAAQALIPV